MPDVSAPRLHDSLTLHIEGPLRAPVSTELGHRVDALLRSGERKIVLDLARVPRIDAAGVGELVRAYSMTIAANGVLQVVHASAWVREILERVGVLHLLTARSDGRCSKNAIAG